MRIPLLVLGFILAAVGGVWIGQGLGYLKGSFMTGQMLWTWIGVALLLVGAALVGTTLGRRRL